MIWMLCGGESGRLRCIQPICVVGTVAVGIETALERGVVVSLLQFQRNYRPALLQGASGLFNFRTNYHECMGLPNA